MITSTTRLPNRTVGSWHCECYMFLILCSFCFLLLVLSSFLGWLDSASKNKKKNSVISLGSKKETTVSAPKTEPTLPFSGYATNINKNDMNQDSHPKTATVKRSTSMPKARPGLSRRTSFRGHECTQS